MGQSMQYIRLVRGERNDWEEVNDELRQAMSGWSESEVPGSSLQLYSLATKV